MHSQCKSCLYCGLVQYVSLGEAPAVKSWKRPVLAVAGVALTICTVMALRFSWERADAVFFATVSVILMMIALLGVVISLRGCDPCVARFLGRTL
jgi:urea transporter